MKLVEIIPQLKLMPLIFAESTAQAGNPTSRRDVASSITKEAYASASPELIALAREDRRQRNQAKVRAGVLCEYVLNGLPEKTEWRTLQEWRIDQKRHPVQVVGPKTGDYTFVLLPADDSGRVETLFQGPESARFNGASLRVRKKAPVFSLDIPRPEAKASASGSIIVSG